MKLDTSKLHLDVLDDTRQELLHKVTPFVTDFILGGGTALSLQIRHRISFDFDFFSEKEIPKNLSEKLSNVIEIKKVAVDSGDELTFFDSNNVKFTFLFHYFKPCYEVLQFTNGLNLFSAPEIAVKKAYTIGRRGVYRDYFDLCAILKNKHITLENIIGGAEKEYKGLFSVKLFLEQLVYFKDIPDFEIMPVHGQEAPLVHEVQEFLERQVTEYLETDH